jgi:transposase-like protein
MVMPRPRKPASPFRYFNSSPEIIRLVVMMYVRYPLSLRNVEDLLFDRGVDICHETVRLWWNRFGPMFASEIRRQRISRSYPAAMRDLGNLERREMGRWLNNQVENSHLPFRRRERAMLRFRQMKSLQKFASVHANVHNHFNQERHLIDRQTYKANRSAALAEWQNLLA